MRILRLCLFICTLTFICTSGLAWTLQAAPAQANPNTQAPPQQVQAPPAQAHSDQAYTLPPDKLQKAITLNKIRLTLDIVGTLWGLAVLWLLLSTRTAAQFGLRVQDFSRHGWIQGLIFFAAFILVTTIASLPLDMIGHAVSLHYGISVQQWPSWFGDLGKGLALSLVFGSLLLLLFNWLVRVSTRWYWFWSWLISVPLGLVLVFLAPVVIDPIFNKFEPLVKTHPQLVSRLEQVVAKTGTNIPPDRMFLMKASAKSNGLNAYVTGIGSTKRFVMWDTATDRLPDDEVLFVFGHESGHYVLKHIPKMMAMSAFGTLILFWICARAAEAMVRRYAVRWEIDSVASRAGFITILFMLSIGGFLMSPISNTISRHYEHEADIYGQEAIHGLVADPQKTAVSGFDHLGEAWLEDPHPNPFVEFWMYNHPSVQNRAKFARQYDPWKNGGRGKFFQY